MIDDLACKMLVTCCNEKGGLYQISIQNGEYKMQKRLEEHLTGIARYGDRFVVANASQLLLVDNELHVAARNKIAELDFHGVQIHNQYAYVVETERNTIGVYHLPDFQRTGEIRFNLSDRDYNHLNDVHIANDRLFVSMFSMQEPWRQNNGSQGTILEVSLPDRQIVNIHQTGLVQPHSVLFDNHHLFYCNSGVREVRQGTTTIFQTDLYPRGLAKLDAYLFIGQSLSRNMTEPEPEASELSRGCGINIYNTKSEENCFIPLPSKEIYGILIE